MSSIRNIVFDFGNVLFDLDLSAIGREIQRLVGDQYETVRERLQRSGVFELYETGGLTTEEFVDAIRLVGPAPLSAEQVTAAWNSIFIGMPRERFDMLLCLRQQYNVFLLNNINDLHATWIDDYMLRQTASRLPAPLFRWSLLLPPHPAAQTRPRDLRICAGGRRNSAAGNAVRSMTWKKM